MTSRRGLVAAVPLICGAVLGMTLTDASAAPLPAEPGASRIVASRDEPRMRPANLPQSVKVTVSPGATAATGYPALPTSGRRMDVTITPDSNTVDLATSAFATVLPGLSNKQRLLTCAAIAGTGFDIAADSPAATASTNQLIALSLASECFRIVGELARAGQATAAGRGALARASSCGTQYVVAVPVTITRSAAGYTVQATGPGRNAKAKYRVTCTVGSNGAATLRVAARSKRATLKSALGGGINLGFSAAPTLPAAVGLTTTFGVVK